MPNQKTIQSAINGPVVTIMGGIHGDEFCGYRAVEFLMKNLKLKKGTVHLIIANQLAIEADARQVNYNMNRIFLDNLSQDIQQTYEYQRSLEIRDYLDRSDILIDLHSSVEGSKPFIICESNGLELASSVNVTNILTNIDAFHPGSTDGYMNNRDRIGICIECGYKRDPNSTDFAIQSVLQMLTQLDMLADIDQVTLAQDAQSIYRSEYIYTAKSEDFKLSQSFTDFDSVPAQTCIAQDGGQAIEFETDYHILFANPAAQAGQEAFLLVRQI